MFYSQVVFFFVPISQKLVLLFPSTVESYWEGVHNIAS